MATTTALPRVRAEEFDLDITFTGASPVIGGQAQDTSDNCGSTSQSACVTCITEGD